MMDTSLDVDSSTFDTEPVSSLIEIKLFVFSQRRMNLSPFKALAIREDSRSWARASQSSNLILVSDQKEAIVKASDTDFDER